MNEALDAARQLQRAGRLEEAEAACRVLLGPANGADETAIRILLALILIQQDRAHEADEMIGDLSPTTDMFAISDFGLVTLLRGDPARARELLQQVTASAQADYAAFARLGSALLLEGDLEGGEAAIREALQRSPEHPLVLSNLGGALMRQNKVEEAMQAYEAALRLNPDFHIAEKGRTGALLMLDRADELLEEIEGHLDKEPGSIEWVLRRSQILVAVERLEEARDVYRDLVERHPNELAYRLPLAALHTREEQHYMALKVLRKADQDFPDRADVLNMLARTYNNMKHNDKAYEVIARVMELSPEQPAGLMTRAAIHSENDRYAEAEADLRQVLETHPGIAEAWSLLGHTLLWTGRLDEAVECMERAAKINPGALAALVEARSIPDDPKVIELMGHYAVHRVLPSDARASMNFALIKVFEKNKQYARAFECADEGNRLQREKIKHDHRKYSARTDEITRVFSGDLFRRLEGLGNFSERPVFVVGMPRSGTTLTEQLLSSHPEVFGAGELGVIPAITNLMPSVLKIRQHYPRCMQRATQRTIDHAATYYLQALLRRDSQARRVVDKLPHNFMHLGLIAILFPYAKIIHIRRELRDLAVSNYFTNFKMKRGGMGYAFDLAEIGHMINDYRRIMDHWRTVLPIEMYEFDYEALISDPEQGAKQLISHVGLAWDPAVMDFNKQDRAVRTASVWQVRQPIYKTSRGRWKNYQEFLAPLDDVLREYVEKPWENAAAEA
jgi:tetratricopeptide (TPR) repeat protein